VRLASTVEASSGLSLLTATAAGPSIQSTASTTSLAVPSTAGLVGVSTLSAPLRATLGSTTTTALQLLLLLLLSLLA